MIKLLSQIEVLSYKLGALGILGLLGLMCSLFTSLILLLPAEQELNQKKQEVAILTQQPKEAIHPQKTKLSDEQSLQKFYQQFPPTTDLSKILAQIHQLATEKGISLVVGEYKMAPDFNNPRLMRYAISFPVQSNYKKIYDFIATASDKFPSLGLSDVSIKRDSVKDGSVQIKLSYVLFLRRS
jgi:Tfp pilus assembly protein PilO